MKKDKIGLSRRKVLLGLGAVGVASAGAGLGTTAYFSDEESFTDNQITAGRFELDVEGTITHVDQGDYTEFSLISEGDSEMATASGFIQLDDVKPGDSLEVCFDPTVLYNPGYVCVNLDVTEDLTGDENSDVDVSHLDEDLDQMTLGDTMNAELCWESVDFEEGDDLPESISLLGGSGEELTLNELVDVLNDDAHGILVPSQDAELCLGEPSSDADSMSAATRVCLKLDLPIGFGNATQGAAMAFDVDFKAEQCRHNDNPFEGMCINPLEQHELIIPPQ